ncbi:MAG TPA: hypothetical protein VLX58_03585 [Bryobacteraceae bacterium]|nr:hypothetical protein [Bryobacteraceae bacterium]
MINITILIATILTEIIRKSSMKNLLAAKSLIFHKSRGVSCQTRIFAAASTHASPQRNVDSQPSLKPTCRSRVTLEVTTMS